MCAAAVLVSGCSSITNLTPSQLPRSDSGLYPFEVVFESKATALADDSIQAYLILDDQMIKMQRTPLLTNRWWERRVYPIVIKLIINGKILVRGERIVDFQSRFISMSLNK